MMSQNINLTVRHQSLPHTRKSCHAWGIPTFPLSLDAWRPCVSCHFCTVLECTTTGRYCCSTFVIMLDSAAGINEPLLSALPMDWLTVYFFLVYRRQHCSLTMFSDYALWSRSDVHLHRVNIFIFISPIMVAIIQTINTQWTNKKANNGN